MEALDALAPVVAVMAPAALVLRDVATGDRAPARPRPAHGGDPAAAPSAASGVAVAGAELAGAGVADLGVADLDVADLGTEPGVGLAPGGAGADGGGGAGGAGAAAWDGGYEPVHVETGIELTAVSEPEPHSLLSGLRTETDERSPVRRAVAFVLLLVITLAIAAFVAAGIYNAASAFR